MATDHLRNAHWILLPGTLCTDAVFSGFLDALDIPLENRQSIAVNNPTIEDYASLPDDTNANTIVCGFSLGAIVAAHYADRINASRIILFAINPYADDPAKADGRHELAHAVRDQGGSTALIGRLPTILGPRPIQTQASILEMADNVAGDIDAQTNLALTRPGTLGALAQAQSPVMVLTGDQDKMAPVTHGRAAAAAAPNGQYRELTDLSHYALLENPAACAHALLEMEHNLL